MIYCHLRFCYKYLLYIICQIIIDILEEEQLTTFYQNVYSFYLTIFFFIDVKCKEFLFENSVCFFYPRET